MDHHCSPFQKEPPLGTQSVSPYQAHRQETRHRLWRRQNSEPNERPVIRRFQTPTNTLRCSLQSGSRLLSRCGLRPSPAWISWAARPRCRLDNVVSDDTTDMILQSQQGRLPESSRAQRRLPSLQRGRPLEQGLPQCSRIEVQRMRVHRAPRKGLSQPRLQELRRNWYEIGWSGLRRAGVADFSSTSRPHREQVRGCSQN